ncbi:MAG: hypothetical protein ACO3YQ_05235 [Flavobacteriales bacterium]
MGGSLVARVATAAAGLAVLIAVFHTLGSRQTWSGRRAAEAIYARPKGTRAVAVWGSSNVREALDVRDLEMLDRGSARMWFNFSESGLTGVALLCEVREFVEALPAGPLEAICLEILPDPADEQPLTWRTARYVPLRDAVTAHREALKSPCPKSPSAWHARRLIEHALMRSAAGLHALLYPDAPDAAPIDFRAGGGKSMTAISLDAEWMRVQQEKERMNRAVLAGEPPAPCSPTLPAWLLEELQHACAARGIRLIPVLVPTADAAGACAVVNETLGEPPLLLDGGQERSPFTQEDLLADPVHVNARGADLVTAAFHREFLKRITGQP